MLMQTYSLAVWKGGMCVEKGKREMDIRCCYAQEGDDLLELLLDCFCTFLYKEIQKSAHF